MELRNPTLDELRLIDFLIKNSKEFYLPKDWRPLLKVKDMEDGGMGSLLLFPEGKIRKNRIFGGQISEFQFQDDDGIQVVASLNVDKNGELFELDIWKTNFSKLIRIPEKIGDIELPQNWSA